jgi:uncharacterized protein (TIGR03437 family)
MRPSIADMISSRKIGDKSRRMRGLTKGYNAMSNFHFTKILVTLTVLLVCVSLMQAQTSPLTATPSTVALTFQKGSGQGSGPGASVSVLVTATASTDFTVDPTSVPIWLTLSAMSGTANTNGASITFNPPPSTALIGAGTYGAIVKLDAVTTTQAGVPVLTMLSIPVSLVVSDATPTLTVSGQSGLIFNWRQGTPLPTPSRVVVYSKEPLSFTVAVAVTSPTNPPNWIHIVHASAVAYSWGTAVPLTFDPLLAYTTNLGDTLSGTVTITPAVGNALTAIPVTITVTAPVAAINAANGVYPAAIPPQPDDANGYTFIVSGSGFVDAATTSVKVNGTKLTTGVTVLSGTAMTVTISDQTLKTAGTVTITAYNNGTDTPASTTVAVTTAPIIYAATNSATYVQQAPGATPNVAPYDLISIFGDNFGPTGANVVNGTPDTTFFNFPTTLASGGHNIVVNFYKADGTTLIAAAPLMFASEQQINVVVPAAVTGNAKVYIAVSYNAVASSQYAANVVAADPGIFTTNASGTGQGAILNSDYTANSSAVAAKTGNTVMIYVAGLGTPTSTGTNTTQTTQAFPKQCISTAAYMGTVNGQSVPPNPVWANIDGAVIHNAWLATKTFPPCFATAPTVSIGGKAATVTYAGFVADSVAGLYQINATIPTSVTAGTAVPVVVTVGTASSPAGVTMAVTASASLGH